MSLKLSILSPNLSRWGAALIAAALIAALPLLGAPAQAAPSDELSWSIRPGGDDSRTNFSYDLEAGAKKKDAFEVTNLGSNEVSLTIYAADGITSSSGALDLLPANDPSTVVGSWVKVSEPKITLSPGETESVDFTLEVPKNTAPGDYVGGLISSYLDTASGGTVVVDQRLANRVNVRVGGEGTVFLETQDLNVLTPLAWNPFAPTTATVTFTLNNSGTVRARGNYSITTSGLFGWGESTKTFSTEELIPGSSVNVIQEFGGIWPIFSLTTKVTTIPEGIDGASGTEHVSSISSWNIPWGQIGLLLILIAVALIIGLRQGRYYEDELEDGLEDSLAERSTNRT
ncbi:hypothetical protein CQ018_12950 [Arthrobacter sp. MYb227]|uniref:WxL protein peptidoglycan domain-containing protein n=1 Tax=Arthrobacter sp. MYb227 TaxID=1848601 RepID=UPI000CFD9263|nr:DUF916 domain-containing protein [Arthrobacter sp. MYb227]PQZ91550.1 hypothetical protein CQ018_12950 [Arthrobacter sp. MYb227]